MAALAMLLLTHAPFRARLVRPSLQTHMQRASTLVGTAEPDGSRLCIIDAHNLAYRMYHALPVLTSRTGEPAHALLGFCNKLWKLRDVFPGYNMLCVFDEGAPARRIEMLPEYKETRARMPGTLRQQMGHIREAAECFGVSTISQYGIEADDLIATAVSRARNEGLADVCVVSSDKDLLQLITSHHDCSTSTAFGASTNVTVFDDRKKLLLDAAAVRAKYHGVDPAQLVDLFALVGDISDNVPGIPGIGPKTAAKLILEYGSLEAVLEAAPSMKKSKRRDALIEFSEMARLAKRLILLDNEVDVESQSLRGLRPAHPVDLPDLRPFLQHHGFVQLERRLYSAREEIATQLARRQSG